MKVYRKLSLEFVAEAARRFRSRVEFQRGAKSEYHWALAHEKLDAVCAHMTWQGNTPRTSEQVAMVAMRFSTRSEFERGAIAEYTWAKRHGVMDAICGHMKWVGNVCWTIETATAAAKNFDTRGDFERAYVGAYEWACRNRCLDEVCSHMKPAISGFARTKSGFLYFAKFKGPSGEQVFKVGITNRDACMRLKETRIDSDWSASLQAEIFFENGIHAHEQEQLLMAECHSHAYVEGRDGPRFLKNGYTELFRVDMHRRWKNLNPSGMKTAAQARKNLKKLTRGQ